MLCYYFPQIRCQALEAQNWSFFHFDLQRWLCVIVSQNKFALSLPAMISLAMIHTNLGQVWTASCVLKLANDPWRTMPYSTFDLPVSSPRLEPPDCSCSQHTLLAGSGRSLLRKQLFPTKENRLSTLVPWGRMSHIQFWLNKLQTERLLLGIEESNILNNYINKRLVLYYYVCCKDSLIIWHKSNFFRNYECLSHPATLSKL